MMRAGLVVGLVLLLPPTLSLTYRQDRWAWNHVQPEDEDVLEDKDENFLEDEGEDEDVDILTAPAAPHPVEGYHEGPLPPSLALHLLLLYDSSLLASMGGDTAAAEVWVARVVEQARPLLLALAPSSLVLRVVRVAHLPETVALTAGAARELARARGAGGEGVARATAAGGEGVALLVANSSSALKGLAFLGSACRRDGFALSITARRETEGETARTRAG